MDTSHHITSFMLYLATERGLSTAYQLSVRQTLEALGKWMDEKNIGGLENIGTDELAAFLAYQKDKGLNPSSLRVSMVHLKIFFRHLTAKNILPADPAEPLLPPRADQHLPETLNQSHVEKLLESIDPAQPLGRRDRAMLELFYASGLRLSELIGARLENLDLDEKFIR
ncbi:MAG: tyrosine-type recombinase/integrase, partial [Akkermansiaceae bacterium]